MIALSVAKIRELDALYAERSSAGHPGAWGVLVEELRVLQRAIEAGGRSANGAVPRGRSRPDLSM